MADIIIHMSEEKSKPNEQVNVLQRSLQDNNKLFIFYERTCFSFMSDTDSFFLPNYFISSNKKLNILQTLTTYLKFQKLTQNTANILKYSTHGKAVQHHICLSYSTKNNHAHLFLSIWLYIAL